MSRNNCTISVAAPIRARMFLPDSNHEKSWDEELAFIGAVANIATFVAVGLIESAATTVV